MDIQTKVEFYIDKKVNTDNIPSQVRYINKELYPDGNLGENFVVFYEYSSVTVAFESDDPNACLEIECFDIDGMAILKPGDKRKISPGGDSEDMLVPGEYAVEVHTSKGSYTGLFRVEPSNISWNSLLNLRKYLENICRGLSLNLYLKRIGKHGNNVIHNAFLSEIYNYIVTYQDTLFNNLDYIIKNPITNIVKQYREQVYSVHPDVKSQRWLSQKGISLNRNLYMPEVTYEKHSVNDIYTVENQWVRKIINHIILIVCELSQNFEEILNSIIQRKELKIRELTNEQTVYNRICHDLAVSKEYKRRTENMIEVLGKEIKELTENSSFICNILGNIKRIKALLLHYEHETWLKYINGFEKVVKPTIKLLKEYRYSQLYYFYNNLKEMQKSDSVHKKSIFPNKKTSKLFEYYIVTLIISILKEEGFDWESGWLADRYDNKVLNGELQEETVMVFTKGCLICEIAYDTDVSKKVPSFDGGYFTRNNARYCRPDIRIALYDKITRELLSAAIVEVKYRKSKYLYSKNVPTDVMDKIVDYINFGYYDNITKSLKFQQIKSVIVTYPKQSGEVKYDGEYNFSFIPIEPMDEGQIPYGYDILKHKLTSVLFDN